MTSVLHLVDDDGAYQDQAVEAFLREQQLDAAGVNYQIIAIMGPQSSGKSTLMNAVVRPLQLSTAPPPTWTSHLWVTNEAHAPRM